MKILYGITKSNFGGAQRYLLELAKEAKEHGHEVAVVCGGTGVLVNQLEAEGIKIFSAPHMSRDISTLNDARSFFYLLEVLGEFKPEVFHINSSKMGGIGALAGRLMKVPKIIFTAHGWAFNEPRPGAQKLIIKFFAWITILLSHKTICVSEKTKQDISGMPFVKHKLEVVYNGIRKPNFLSRKEAREKFALGIPSDVLVVGTISELHRIKSLDVLLNAWSRFSKKQNARLVIIGDGEERKNLELQAESLGISDSVIFKGFVDNARALLPGFDIFILASRSEALPYSVLEAGTAGLPTIATKVGGIPEIIESGKSGILVPPEDSEAMFSSLMLLAGDAELRKRLGKELKTDIQNKFLMKRMLDETFRLYS